MKVHETCCDCSKTRKCKTSKRDGRRRCGRCRIVVKELRKRDAAHDDVRGGVLGAVAAPTPTIHPNNHGVRVTYGRRPFHRDGNVELSTPTVFIPGPTGRS